MRQVYRVASSTVLEVCHYRLPLLAVAVLVLSLAAAQFAAAIALTEAADLRDTLLAGFLRHAAVLLVMLVVTTGMVRELEDNTIALLLSLPLPRWAYLLGRAAGYLVAAAALAALYAAAVLAVSGKPAALLWAGSLSLELALVALLAMLLALGLRQVAAAMIATLLVYLLARALHGLLLVVQGAQAVDPSSTAMRFAGGALAVLDYLLPDLDRFTLSGWLGGGGADWALLGPLAAQAAIYAALLLGVALVDLYRREIG